MPALWLSLAFVAGAACGAAWEAWRTVRRLERYRKRRRGGYVARLPYASSGANLGMVPRAVTNGSLRAVRGLASAAADTQATPASASRTIAPGFSTAAKDGLRGHATTAADFPGFDLWQRAG